MVERPKPQLTDELRYRLLKVIEARPSATQRELAAELGVSLGKINYCIRAVAQKGLIKARNFRNSENKLGYAYYLTPRGIEEKAALMFEFLKLRLREVELLRQEIAELQSHSTTPAAESHEVEGTS